MKQLDLFTGQESTHPPKNFNTPRIYSSGDLEFFLGTLNVVDVGLTLLPAALHERYERPTPITIGTFSGKYRSLCPFHSEKTASFYLRPPPQNRFVCYGCGIQGGPLRLWDRLDPVSLEGLLEHIGLSEYKRDLFDGTEYFNDVDKSGLELTEEQQQYYRLFLEVVRKETW